MNKNIGETEKRKRGRPKVGIGTRHNRVQCKMTDEELEMLQYLCEVDGKTMTAALLDSVRMSYNLAKYRE